MGVVIQKPFRGTQLNQSHNLVRNLITCVLLNENTGKIAANNVIGKPNGEISGASWQSGRYGPELDFSGSTSDVVDLGVPFLGSEQTELSVEAIVRIETLSVSQIIAENGTGIGQSSFLFARGASNDLTFYVYGTDRSQRRSVTTVVSGVYYHFVGTWTPGSYPDIYVNGVLDNGATVGITVVTIIDGDSTLQLGKRPGSTAISLDGGISLFRVYNKALNASEVTQLYRNPFEMFSDWDYRFLAGTIKQIDLQETDFTLLGYTLSTLLSLLLQSGQATLLDFAIETIGEIILQEINFTLPDYTLLVLFPLLFQASQATLLDFATQTTQETALQEIDFTFFPFEPIDVDFLNAIIHVVVREGFEQ